MQYIYTLQINWLPNTAMESLIPTHELACVASISLRFGSNEFHAKYRKSSSLAFLCSQTPEKRLLSRLFVNLLFSLCNIAKISSDLSDVGFLDLTRLFISKRIDAIAIKLAWHLNHRLLATLVITTCQ